jgi:hypothetical protein
MKAVVFRPGMPSWRSEYMSLRGRLSSKIEWQSAVSRKQSAASSKDEPEKLEKPINQPAPLKIFRIGTIMKHD